jgi:hypothetical protein
MLNELIFEKLNHLLVPMWKLDPSLQYTMSFSFCNVSSKLKGGLGVMGSFSVVVG